MQKEKMELEEKQFVLQREQVRLRVNTKVCPTCDEQFDDSEHTVCPVDQSLLCPVRNDSLIGQRISKFEIVSKIGSGSSSNVYLAKSTGDAVEVNGSASANVAECKTTIDQVAVKVLDANLLSNPTAIKRFQLEAQLVSSLNHPRIASVLDFGVLSDGRPYLILEYVEGETLKEHLDRKGKLELNDAVCIIGDVLQAIEGAHQVGILHRDIKPSNIMIDTTGRAKVLDFGIAKVIGIEDTTTVTLTGVSVGTPAYMSPEQCLGKEQDVRSDIYSLGCLMYECISGSKVFPSENAFSCMRQHSFFEPVHLSKLVHDLPSPIANAVMKCLEKDPDNRIQSMNDLSCALLDDTFETSTDPDKQAGPLGSENRLIKLVLYLIPLLTLLAAFIFFNLKTTHHTWQTVADNTRDPIVAALETAPSLLLPPKPLTPNEIAEVDSILNKARYDAVSTISMNKITRDPTELAVGTHSLSGLIGKEDVIDLPIFAGVRDASGNDWYVIARDGLIRYDAHQKKCISIPVPNGLPDTRFCTGIARDTKRDRILVLTVQFAENSNLVNNTTLLAYTPTTNKWTELAKVKDLELHGLGYSPSDDSLYSMAFTATEDGLLHSGKICQLTADGAIKSMIKPSEDFRSLMMSMAPFAQIAVHDRFVIITLEGRDCTAIDRNTGRIVRKWH